MWKLVALRSFVFVQLADDVAFGVIAQCSPFAVAVENYSKKVYSHLLLLLQQVALFW